VIAIATCGVALPSSARADLISFLVTLLRIVLLNWYTSIGNFAEIPRLSSLTAALNPRFRFVSAKFEAQYRKRKAMSYHTQVNRQI
jgi:hypothetical protein